MFVMELGSYFRRFGMGHDRIDVTQLEESSGNFLSLDMKSTLCMLLISLAYLYSCSVTWQVQE